MIGRAFVIVALVCRVTSGFAQPAEGTPALEEAKRLFHEGAVLYDAKEYQQALERFLAAQALTPVPELDYNIARCLDTLARYADAIDHYERFLAARPGNPSSIEIHARIAVLHERLEAQTRRVDAAPPPPPLPPPLPPPRRSDAHRFVPAMAVGGLALAGAVVGTALLARTRVDYDACARSSCSNPRIDGMARLAIGGYVALGIAGALAVADAVLWVVAARRVDPRRASLATGVLRF